MKLTTAKAILIGQVVVNIPVLIIMGTFLLLGVSVAESRFIAPIFFAGFVLAWIWWTFSVHRWQQWAMLKGVDPNSIRTWGVRTGLLWPKLNK